MYNVHRQNQKNKTSAMKSYITIRYAQKLMNIEYSNIIQ